MSYWLSEMQRMKSEKQTQEIWNKLYSSSMHMQHQERHEEMRKEAANPSAGAPKKDSD